MHILVKETIYVDLVDTELQSFFMIFHKTFYNLHLPGKKAKKYSFFLNPTEQGQFLKGFNNILEWRRFMLVAKKIQQLNCLLSPA